MDSYFLCATQPTNLGDLVINKMLVNELSKYGKVYVDCYNVPNKFAQIILSGNERIIDVYNVCRFSLKRLDIFKAYFFFKKNKVSMYIKSPGPIGRSSNRIRSYAFRLIDIMFKCLGVHHYSVGNCCSGAICNNEIIRNKYVDKYYMRSYASVEYIKHQGNNANYIPDLAYLLDNPNNTPKKKIALLTFRSVKESGTFELWYEKAIDYLLSVGYDVILYHQVKSDRENMLALYEKHKSDKIKIIEKQIEYENLDVFKNAAIIISNRLHALLVAASYGAVPLAVIANDVNTIKIRDVIESSMKEHSDTFITDYSSIESLCNIVTNRTYYSEYVCSQFAANREKCKQTVKDLCESVDDISYRHSERTERKIAVIDAGNVGDSQRIKEFL